MDIDFIQSFDIAQLHQTFLFFIIEYFEVFIQQYQKGLPIKALLGKNLDKRGLILLGFLAGKQSRHQFFHQRGRDPLEVLKPSPRVGETLIVLLKLQDHFFLFGKS
jgi:hypothetical protein